MGKETELLEAARSGNLVVVEKLLAPKSKGKWSSSIQLSLVQTFLKGPSVNCQDQNGETALHFAALNNHKEIVESLLKFQASANIPDQKGCYPLHLAAWRGNTEICQILLTRGPSVANINAQNLDGDTALHSAAQYGHTSVVTVLLQKCANPLIKNSKGEKALDLAVMFGRQETVEKLLTILDSKTYLNLSRQDKSPLHLAAKSGNVNVVRMLLNAGFNVNHVNEVGTALHEAALHGKYEVFKLLLSQGGDVMLTDDDKKTTIDLLNDLNNPVSADMKKLFQEFNNEKIKTAQKNVDSSMMLLIGEDYDFFPNAANKIQGPDSISHISRNSVGSSTSSVFNSGMTEEESIYDCPQAGARALFPVPGGAKLPLASSSSFNKNEKANTPKKPPRKKVLNSGTTKQPIDKTLTPTSGSDGHLQNVASTTSEPASSSAFTTPTSSISSNKSPVDANIDSLKTPSRMVTPSCSTNHSIGTNKEQSSSLSEEVLKKSTTVPVSNHCNATLSQSRLPSTSSTVQNNSQTSSVSSNVVGRMLPSSSVSSSCGDDKNNNVTCHGCSSATSHNTGNVSKCSHRPGSLTTITSSSSPHHRANAQHSIEPPTPDHPPPSPETALLGIQLHINSERRKSRDMQTSTELEEDVKETPTDLKRSRSPHFNPSKMAAGSTGSVQVKVPLMQKNVELNNNNNIFHGLTLGSTSGSSSSLSSRRSARSQLFCSLMNSKTLPMPLTCRNFSTHKNFRASEYTQLPYKTLKEERKQETHVVKGSQQQGKLKEHVAMTTTSGTLKSDDDKIQNFVIAPLWSGFDANFIMEEFDKRMTNILADKSSSAMLSVIDWLESIDMPQYENVFVVNGFDDMQFMSLLELCDMEELGVKNVEHKEKLNSCCRNLPSPPEPCDYLLLYGFESTRTWLESLRLLEYNDLFVRHNCSSMKDVFHLSELQLQSLFSVMLLGHRKRVRASLQIYRSKIPHKLQDTCNIKELKSTVETTSAAINREQVESAYIHRPESLITGCCNYTVQYLGSKEVSILSGDEPPKLAITKIKDSLACIDEMPSVTLSISYLGVRFIDPLNKMVICSHDISNIFSASQGEDCLQYFAYITQSMEDGNFLCHVFHAKNEELAREIMMTLGEAFFVAYQLAVWDKRSSTEDEDAEPSALAEKEVSSSKPCETSGSSNARPPPLSSSSSLSSHVSVVAKTNSGSSERGQNWSADHRMQTYQSRSTEI